MSMTLRELKAVLEEAAPLLTGRTVLAFRDGGVDCFFLLLEAENGDPPIVRFLLSVRPGLDRAHLTPRRSPKKNRRLHTEFAGRIEEALKGAHLTGAGLPGSDRVVELCFETAEGSKRKLTIELIGRHANMLLLDESGGILECIRSFRGKQRTLTQGGRYLPPPARDPDRRGPEAEPRFRADADPVWSLAPLNGAADVFFQSREQDWERAHLEEKLRNAVKRRIAGLRKKVRRLESELQETGQAYQLRKMGDLLKAQYHRLKKGMKAFETIDLFAEDQEKIVIPLDPAKDPETNITRYYRRAKKLEQSIRHLHRRIRESEEEIRRFEELGSDLEKLDDLEGLEAMAEKLGLAEPARRARRKAPQPPAGLDHRRFRSSDGLDLLVGKDGASNDRLTFQTARGNDIWLHCHEAAGSHVVIRKDGQKPVPLNSLMDAGLLAVHFSKRREADRSDVIYTACKYVKKIRGAQPGRVRVDRFETLVVRQARERLQRILATGEAS